MKRKIYFVLALMIVTLTSLGAEDKDIEKSMNEVEIDLNSDTLTSTDGVNVKYGPLKVKAFNVKRDKTQNKAYIPGDFFLEVDEPTGNLRIDSSNGEFDLSGDKGSFGKTFGYLEVGQVTGAEKPNDRIYFGGEKTQYEGGKTYLRDAWFTTDPKILKTRDANTVGYHLQSDTIVIEPDKQVTFKGSNLYLGDKDVLPFSIPWYRFNIRQGSEVPLFPSWGNDDDYGWFVTSGVLFGDKDSKYRGGFAPKYGDQIGLMIGRMENWYKFDKYGESRLNINDWLIDKKRDESDPERSFNRWDVNYSHNYTGKYGFLNLNYKNATYNMIPTMDDAIDDYFRGQEGEGNGWKYVNGVPDKGGSLGFYNLDTELTGLGEDKDISIKSKVNLVSDKKAYGVIVADNLDDMDYGTSKDYDLMSDVSIKKENKKYSMGAYYNYLYDMDPGSTKEDTQSRGENFGFNFNDKVNKIDMSYDQKTGDKYRELNSWERDPNFSKLKKNGVFGIEYDYTPWTVSEYSIYNSRNGKVTLGEYNLYGDINYKVGYTYSQFEHKLDLGNDPFREKAKVGYGDKRNYRDVEYNRYKDIIYNKTTEQRAFVDFMYDSYKLTLAGGNTQEEIWDREGIYDKEAWSSKSYEIYINNSNFYEVGLSNDKIGLGSLGNLELYGNTRFDQYDKGYNGTREVSTDDSSIRYRAGLAHDLTLFDNTLNRDRLTDITLTNRLTYMYQDYSYGSGGDFSRDLRLRQKENINQVGDTITFDLGNTKTIYSIDYKNIERASTGDKKGEVLNQKLDFLIDDENTFGLDYGYDKRFTDRDGKSTIKNYNDLTFENYGAHYGYKNNYFYYKNRNIDSNLTKITDINKTREKIDENVYGYTYTFGEDKLNLEYIEGKTNRNEIDENIDKKIIDGSNKTYSVSYVDTGDVERGYKASYEDYNNRGERNPDLSKYNSDVVFLSYSYKDKRFSDKELVAYAESEYNKRPDELTSVEIDRIRQVLQDRNNSRSSERFNLNRIIDDRTYFGDYKRSFYTSLMMQRNTSASGDYFNNLEELEGRLFYSRDRIGVGYIYNQKSALNKSTGSWKDSEREHEFSLNAKVGKPSEGWRTKAYVKFYDQLHGEVGQNGRSTFDGFGMEVGKEFGYYEWAIAYERDYSYRTKDYEWKTAIQFKLLTFPTNNIFGIGASTDTDKKTSPDTYLFNGIKIDDID